MHSYLFLIILVSLMSVCTGLGWADIFGRKRGKHFGRLGTALICASMTLVWTLVFSLVAGSFVVILVKLLPSLAIAGILGALVLMNKHAKPIVPKS